METTIILPDALLARADAMAAQRGLTRSELVALALRAYIDAQKNSESVAEINRACAELDMALPSDLAHNARKRLREVEW